MGVFNWVRSLSTVQIVFLLLLLLMLLMYTDAIQFISFHSFARNVYKPIQIQKCMAMNYYGPTTSTKSKSHQNHNEGERDVICIITVLFRLIHFNHLERLGFFFLYRESLFKWHCYLCWLALLLLLYLCRISGRPGPAFLFGPGSSCITHRLLSDLKCLLIPIRTPNIIIPSQKNFEWVSFFCFVCLFRWRFVSFVWPRFLLIFRLLLLLLLLFHLYYSMLFRYRTTVVVAFAQSLIPHHVQVITFRPFQVTAIPK